MFTQRVATAIVGIPIFLSGLYYGGLFWKIIVFFLVLAGLLEFARMGGAGIFPDYLVLSGLSFLLLSYSGINSAGLLIWMVLSLFYYLVRASFSGMKGFASSLNLLGVFYVAVPFSFLWIVREQFGVIWCMFGLIVTWLTDTGAYFGGLRYGKRKLTPELSPKKTREGALCGLLSALLGSVAFAVVVGEAAGKLIALALILSVFAQLGDLVESALKRESAVKDSGSLLPGHGGILDRFDSMNFVFPLLFILLTIFS